MNEHTSAALWVAACASAVGALALTLIGRQAQAHAQQQQQLRGWPLWQAAAWLSTAGIALGAAAGGRTLLLTLAQLLLLPWPLLALVGMRRFHGRVDWPGREAIDWSVLVGCALVVGAAPLWPADSGIGPVSAPAAALLVHLYAASLLVCAGTRPDSRAMHLLGALIALASCAPMIAILPGVAGSALFEASAVMASLACVGMGFIVTTLRFDRSERHLRASRRRLRALASIDALTQMPNRRHFEELATHALVRDPPASAVLMMFDIDHFKQINDQHGHAGGDRALRLVSACVRELLRVQDVPCRHGGDEFVLLLRHAGVHEAMRVASRLVARVQAMSGGASLPPLSLSFGVVQVRPAELLSQAIERADQALYEAKRQGRSRAVAAGDEDSQPRFTESRPLGLTSA